MTPPEKYGAEFERHTSMLTRRGEQEARPHYQFAVGVRPDTDKDATLARSWDIVRELAAWICSDHASFPEDAVFTLVVGWSRSVRPGRGQIFKVWGDRARIAEIAAFERYSDYRPLGGFHVPLLCWEQDVWGELSGSEVRARIERAVALRKENP